MKKKKPIKLENISSGKTSEDILKEINIENKLDDDVELYFAKFKESLLEYANGIEEPKNIEENINFIMLGDRLLYSVFAFQISFIEGFLFEFEKDKEIIKGLEEKDLIKGMKGRIKFYKQIIEKW